MNPKEKFARDPLLLKPFIGLAEFFVHVPVVKIPAIIFLMLFSPEFRQSLGPDVR